MNKALRLSEKWFRVGLWLVAFAFGSFLIEDFFERFLLRGRWHQFSL